MTVPEGLRRCVTCGELSGTFLYADRWDDKPYPTTVLCLCDGIVCPKCKMGSIHRPISEYYNELTQRVIHVPWFGYLSTCAACRSSATTRGDPV